MFFNSVKEINRLRKETNSLLIKGMSNIYLKVTIEKNYRFQNFDFVDSKKLITMPVFGELQLTQISLNIKTSCCNLKNQRSESKTMCGFSIILILKEIMTF